MARTGDSIIKRFQGTVVKEANLALKAYLAPLLSGNAGASELRILAKEFVPFLVQLLKVCAAKVASVHAQVDNGVHQEAEEIFAAMAITIDGLNHLRSMLTGCVFEVEIMRYALVRRLMAWKRYDGAYSQSLLLFRSLCRLSSFPDHKVVTTNGRRNGSSERISKGGSSRKVTPANSVSTDDDTVLYPPQKGDVVAGLAAIVVGSGIDLMWCMAECAEVSLSFFKRAALVPEELAAWIGVLDAGTATKQRDALYRSLFKCSLIMIGDVSKFEASLVQHFCNLTLSHCASSLQSDQYAKVARKLCSTLSCQGPDWGRTALDICARVFEEIMARNELRGAWQSNEFSELVEWFARTCQAGDQVEDRWYLIYKLVEKIRRISQDSPAVILGLYAVGLMLMKADASKVNLGTLNGTSVDMFDKACVLLHGAGEAIKVSLELGPGSAQRRGTANGGVVLGGEGEGEAQKSICVSSAKILHNVQKLFTSYVDARWDAAYSVRCAKTEWPLEKFDCAIGKMLQLFHQVMLKGMRCIDLTESEKCIFKKGFQVSSHASVAALRLSLVRKDGAQESVELVSDVMHYLQPEQKWRLISTTYNMGVQLFNMKEYGLASWPLDLAHKIAWDRVIFSHPDMMCDSAFNEMISEACAKCLALVDTQQRNGELARAKSILIEGLMQWGKAQAERRYVKPPTSLVKTFVKLVVTEWNEAGGKVCSLYSHLADARPPIAAGIVGLLLEEEHAVCEDLRELFPEACHILTEQIMACLLDQLYIGQQFILERSRVLVKRCRDARRHGFDNLPSCIAYITEAVSLLDEVLEGSKKFAAKQTGRGLQCGCVEKQLAAAYSILAICLYEEDHCCQQFLPNVELSLDMWTRALKSDHDHGCSSELECSLETTLHDDEPLVLLLSMIDILSIQGYSVLVCQVQVVILELISNSNKYAIEEWIEFWMNGRVGHVLCGTPVSTAFVSNIRQSLDPTSSVEEFWQRYFSLFPGSILEAHHHSVQDFPGANEAAGRRASALEAIKQIKQDGQKSNNSMLETAGLYHLISEIAFLKGDTCEAMKYGSKALQSRARLFKHVFRRPVSAAPGVVSGDFKVTEMREHVEPLTTPSWPFSIKINHYLSHPSHWRIIGDYIESLMQVGVIFERMGVVDEAERNFREGCRLALAWNLPIAVASFSSCLGELHRKKHLWKMAETYFLQAKDVFDILDSSRCCESCILTGRALFELRTGDLVRHCSASQLSSHHVDQELPTNLTDAVSNYTAAIGFLSSLLREAGINLDLEERLVSDDTQIKILRSLRKQAKNVSLEIMSHGLEETEISSATNGKPRLRKSVRTRRATVSKSEVVNSVKDKSVSALCERFSSLSANSGEMSQVQTRHPTSNASFGGDGFRSEVQSSRDTVTLKAHRGVQDGVEVKVDLRVERNLSLMTGSGSCHSLHSSSRGVLFFPENFAQLGRRLLGRVLLQKARCSAQLRDLDAAAGMYQHASDILGSSLEPKYEDGGGSFFPVEEGALLYHVSRLCLLRGQTFEEARHAGLPIRLGSDDLEACKAESMSRLYRAFSLCNQVPLLLHKVSKLLAILHVPPAQVGPITTSQSKISEPEMAELAAYFHQVSLGTTIRQQHLSVLDSKLNEPTSEYSKQCSPCLTSVCVEKMQKALRVGSVDVQTLGMQARECLESLPGSSACCISFVSMEDVQMLRGVCLPAVQHSDAKTDWLLVSRLTLESKPVVVLLPVVPVLENPLHDVNRSLLGRSSFTPYDISDDDSDNDSKKVGGVEKTCPSDAAIHIHKQNQTVLQRVAAEFGSVLEESRLSTGSTQGVSTKEEKNSWWKWRMQLDVRLALLLRSIEDLWLGPFKCLLLGEPQQASTAKAFELLTSHLLELMSSTISQRSQGRTTRVDQSFLKLLLQGVGSLKTFQLEKAIAEMLGCNDYCCCEPSASKCQGDCAGCRWKVNEAVKHDQICNISNLFRAAYSLSVQSPDSVKLQIDESAGKRRSGRRTKGKLAPNKDTALDFLLHRASEDAQFTILPFERQPLQLILDSEAQALPWESLPILRNFEIYRMPSLGSTHALYIQHQFASFSTQEMQEAKVEKVKRNDPCSVSTAKEANFDKPVDVIYVNPNNTYYILNPNGDLPSTQAAFEDWFTQQPGWKGKAGTVPTPAEYQMGLQNHALFIYLGHGSGDQFLPDRYVRQLNHCAASLLMGCSSGRLSLRGNYQPVGVVLSYLMAGCPAIVANLWDVTDGDIDRFSRFLLHSWLGSKQPDISDRELAEEDSPNVNAACQVRPRSEVNRRLLQKLTGEQDAFQQMHRMGSAMGHSRDACRLPHLIGASPVCYGVPTGVWKQLDMRTEVQRKKTGVPRH